MPRIRSIKPEFWSDPVIGELEIITRLFYIALWNFADDEGRGRAIPKELAGFAFPHDEDIDSREVRELLARLREKFRIILYEHDGEQLFQICSWERHQKPDHPTKSRYPPPTERDLADSRDSREKLAKPLDKEGGRNQELGNRNQEVGSRSEGGKAAARPPPRPKFIPPTVEEAEALFAENGFPGLGKKFVSHYAQQGWKRNNGIKVTDWRESINGWVEDEKKKRTKIGSHSKTIDQQESELEAVKRLGIFE